MLPGRFGGVHKYLDLGFTGPIARPKLHQPKNEKWFRESPRLRHLFSNFAVLV